MTQPDDPGVPVQITKDKTFISLALAVTAGGFLFWAGAVYQKIARLDDAKFDEQLASFRVMTARDLSLIQTDLALIKHQLGLRSPVRASAPPVPP